MHVRLGSIADFPDNAAAHGADPLQLTGESQPGKPAASPFVVRSNRIVSGKGEFEYRSRGPRVDKLPSRGTGLTIRSATYHPRNFVARCCCQHNTATVNSLSVNTPKR